jgi:hypothetical protein
MRDGHVSGVLHPVTVPARVIGNFFVVEARLDGRGPFRFLVDSASSISLVSSAVARALPVADEPLRARTPQGGEVSLPQVRVARARLGDATFLDVPAGVHDFGELSAQLGTAIDGVFGLSVFRDVLLTLDYPAERLVLDPHGRLAGTSPDEFVALYGAGVPLTRVRVGAQEAAALLDTGSDVGLALAPASGAAFTTPPRPGPLRATLAGETAPLVGRLAAELRVGSHAVANPLVEVAEGPAVIGGAILRHFAVTFDQQRERVALRRGEGAGPLTGASARSVGLSFRRAASGWEVAAVIADTPAAALPIRAGDICVQIDGEPVAAWPIDRFNARLRTAERVTLTFASAGGPREHSIPVVDLVP